MRDGRTYSEVASRATSPTHDSAPSQPAAAAGSSQARAAGTHAGGPTKAPLHRRATVEEVMDVDAASLQGSDPEDEQGPWRELKHGRHSGRQEAAHPLGTPPARMSSVPQGAGQLADTRVDLPRPTRLFAGTAQGTRRRARSHSLGEGTSKRQGKTVDPRNWGNHSGIPAEELDPEVQRKQYTFYTDLRNKISYDDDLDEGAQRAILEHYDALKAHGKTRKAEREGAFLKNAPSVSPDIRSESVSASAATTVGVQPRPTPQLRFSETPIEADNNALKEQVRQLHVLLEQLTAQQRGSESNDGSFRADSTAKKSAHASTTGAGRDSKRSSSSKAEGGIDAMKPATQVEPKSYLGEAFATFNNDPFFAQGASGGEPDGDPDDSDSCTAADDARSGYSKNGPHTKTKEKVPIHKPHEPEKYGGKADMHIFHKFMREVQDYVQDYRLPQSKHARTASYYMTGKAYEFYTTQVSKDPSRWVLHDFFTGLFNYCFPVNFRLEQRQKLRNAEQGNSTVNEFVHRLETLFLTVGIVSEEEKVIYLWQGLHDYLQTKLWEFNYSPTSSSWDEVVAAAVRYEIAAKQLARLNKDKSGYVSDSSSEYDDYSTDCSDDEEPGGRDCDGEDHSHEPDGSAEEFEDDVQVVSGNGDPALGDSDGLSVGVIGYSYDYPSDDAD